MIFKIITTFVFGVVFFVRAFCADITIDNTSIIILVLAFVPWTIQYIKSLEINGIGKVELFNKEKKEEIEKNAQSAGLVEKNIYDKYTFYDLKNDDPKLALAGLRIEIEKKLRAIAEKESLEIRNVSLGKLTNTLSQHQLLDSNEIAIIRDLTVILNKAVHSQIKDSEYSSLEWVYNIGLKLLNSLDEKLK